MKPEKALETVNRIIALSPEKKLILEVIEHNEKFSKPALQWQFISNLYLELKDEITRTEAKATGNTKRLQAAKRILKKGGESHTALEYAYIKNGKQYFTDGFRLAILKSPLPLPNVPEDEIYPDVSYFERMADISNYKIIDTPDVNELQAYIKIQKANKVKYINYSFGEEFTTVSAPFLLDMLTIIPNAEIRFTGRKNALILVNDSGDVGLLMPINALATPKTKLV